MQIKQYKTFIWYPVRLLGYSACFVISARDALALMATHFTVLCWYSHRCHNSIQTNFRSFVFIYLRWIDLHAIKLTACYWDVVFCVHVILHKAYRITIYNKEWTYTFCLSNENVIFFKDHGQDFSKDNPMII